MSGALLNEYAFARLLGIPVGQRGQANDADGFRTSDPKFRADVLSEAADAIERRGRKLGLVLPPNNAAQGSLEAQIESAIERLREGAKALRKLEEENAGGFHWDVIGAFASIVAALLAERERSTP